MYNMANEQDKGLIEGMGAFLSKEGAMSVTRLLIGVAFGAVVGAPGVGAASVIGVAVGIVGLTGLAHYSIQRQKKETLLQTYHEEISHMLGKPESELTVDDLQRAARTPDNPQGSTAISMALDYFKDTRNFFIGAQAATAALMIGGLSVANNLGLPAITLAGASGLLYNELFRAVTNVGSLIYDGNIEGTITREIRAITNQIALGGRISSTRVLGVIVNADPELATQVENKYGHPYVELSISEKRELVNNLKPGIDAEQLARDINIGRILPTELAFAAFSEKSGVAPRDAVEDMHMETGPSSTTRWREQQRRAAISPREDDFVAQLDIEHESSTNHLGL